MTADSPVGFSTEMDRSVIFRLKYTLKGRHKSGNPVGSASHGTRPLALSSTLGPAAYQVEAWGEYSLYCCLPWLEALSGRVES